MGADYLLSFNFVHQYETGKRQPNLHTLNRFAEIFDCSIDYLLGRTDIREIPSIQNTNIDIEYLDLIKELKQKGYTHKKIRNLVKSIEDLNE